MKINKDNSQTLFNLTSQVILNGTNFVLLMLFTRFLTTDNYGIVSVYQAYVFFFSVIVGLNLQGSIGTAFIHIDKKEHDNYLSSIFLLSLISFAAILFLSIIFIKPFEKFSQMSLGLIILMLCHSFGNFCFNFATIKYVYLRKAQYSCILALVLSASMILFSWIGITQNYIRIPQYMGRILGLSVPYIICAAFVFVTILKKGNPFADWAVYWKFCLPICIPLIFHSISQIVLGQTDKIMLQKMADYSVVGIYSFIVTFVHILNSIYMALNNSWVPLYYQYLKEQNREVLFNRSCRYHDLFVILVIGFMMVSPEFVKIFADFKYWGGIELIPLVVLSVYMMFLYSFAANFEFYHRKTKWIAVGTTAAAICNIIMNALLIPGFGMHGAAIATLISYILLFLFHNYCAYKMGKSEYIFKYSFYKKNIIIVLFFCIFFYIFSGFWIIRWMIAVLDAILLIYKVYKHKTFF